MPEMTSTYQRPTWERHLQTVLMALVLGILGWVGTTVLAVSEQQAVQTVRLEHLVRQVDELKQHAGTRYTKSDATRDNSRHDRDMADLERRIERIEETLRRGG